MGTRIKNQNYTKFMNEGFIELLKSTDIEKAMQNVKGPYKEQGQALIVALYATGARPNEVLRLRAKDVYKKDKEQNIRVMLPASKSGLAREIQISPRRLQLIKVLYDYTRKLIPEQFAFWAFKGSYKRQYTSKSGKVKEYLQITDKLRYHVYKWFDGVIPGSIPPYYLRHNRFSAMMASGADPEQVRLIKGAKDFKSVYAYLHMSQLTAKKSAKHID